MTVKGAARSCKKFNDYDSLVALYKSGMGTQEVADALGIGKTTVLKHLKIAGVDIRQGEQNKAAHEALIARIESSSSPFVHYVSGNKKTGVTFKCDKCGHTFIYKSVCKVRFRCPNCEPIEPNRLTKEQKAAREKAHVDSLLDREHVCMECGKRFTERERYNGGKISGKYKFCSTVCKSRYHTRKNRPKRREKYGAYSNWRKIARRDGNLCYLCGKPIDPTDYKRIDGMFTAGPSFGSVDHLVPYKENGGSDEDNLFLAHLSCNSAKGDKSLLRYLVDATMEVSA